MTNGKIDNFYEHKPANGEKPKSMVILLHGYGSDGQDLISLAPLWARNNPDTIFIAPDAPDMCEINPGGYQWYSLREWTHEKKLEGSRQAAPVLKQFIDDRLKQYNLPANKLALAGFSQGTMMSLYVGPRYPEKIAGILGYSGALIWENDIDVNTLQKIPVCLIHGEADTIVSIDSYHHASKELKKHGFDVSGHTTPGLPHSIDQQGIIAGGAFLKDILG